MRCSYACRLGGSRRLAAAIPGGSRRPPGCGLAGGLLQLHRAVGRGRAGEEAAAGAGRSGWPAAPASSRPGTPSRGPTPAARSGRSRPACPACRSASCCRRPPGRCTGWPSSAASTPRRTTTARGQYLMHTGRPQTPAAVYPHLGSVVARCLGTRREPAARLHPHHARRRRQGVERGGLPRAQVHAALPRQRQGPGQHRAGPAVSAAGRRRPPGAARCTSTTASPAAAGPPRPRPTPDLRAGPPADGPPRGLRRHQGAGPATSTATAPTTSAATACWPAGCSRPASTFVKVTPLELRHPPRELRLPHRAARRVRPAVRHAARRPGRARAAGAHAGRRDVGVRPDAADQPPLRPRPLGHGVVGLPWPARDQAGASSARPTPTAPRSSTARSTAATCSTPTSAPSGSTRPSRSRPTAASIQIADPAAPCRSRSCLA